MESKNHNCSGNCKRIYNISSTNCTCHIEKTKKDFGVKETEQNNLCEVAKQKLENTIKYLSSRDSLTGLYNREFFIECLNNEISKAQIKEEKFAIIFLDLNGFKKINDTLGHFTGDKILKLISLELMKHIGNTNIISRFGGDEFFILLPSISDAEEVISVAKEIVNIFHEPFIIDKNQMYISTSIGVVIYPENGLSCETLIKNADIAMYKAKEEKKNSIQFFDICMNEEVSEQFTLGNYLHDALKNEEFLLYYQPIIDISTGKMAAAEALLRWNHPKEGFIPPDRFIPVAENMGLICSIGEWVLRTACRQNKQWQDKGYKPIIISVNVSVKQLEQNNFVELVANILNETQLSPEYLELEITESVSASDINNIIRVLNNLKNLGVKLSMDDFGTGYSSLGNLKKLAISKLKIDKSFIDDIDEQENNAEIASAIIALAKNLKLLVVAEGIEVERQLSFLKENSCHMAQGYLFSKPVDCTSFEKLLKESFL